jgi:hypothetical protein
MMVWIDMFYESRPVVWLEWDPIQPTGLHPLDTEATDR